MLYQFTINGRRITTKTNTYVEKVYTNLPEDGIECEFFAITSIDML